MQKRDKYESFGPKGEAETVEMGSSLKQKPYQLEINRVLTDLQTSPETGLSREDALARARIQGPNQIQEARKKSPWLIFLSQFKDFMVLVLALAALIAGFLGEPQDILTIVAILLLNGILGFIQEYRAEQAIQAIKALAAPAARVLRFGQILTVPSSELVPGDIVPLEAGNLVPADIRLLECVDLQVDESALTGESTAVIKLIDSISEDDLPVADQKNMAFKGTLVTHGRGLGVVIHIGMQTELGKIASLLREEVEGKTPLQKRMAQFAKGLALIVLVLCLIIFLAGLLRGEEPIFMFLTAISLAVAAIPEALPAVVTVALALGAKAMSRRNALIRKLPAVESLGSVTYICSDKTGTLTENKMRVQGVHVGDLDFQDLPSTGALSEQWKLIFQVLCLNNDCSVDDAGRAHGEATEVALLESAIHAGFDKRILEKNYRRIAEIPFSSDRGIMTTLHEFSNERWAFCKGAPEKVFRACSQQLKGNEILPFDSENQKLAVDQLAQKGLRVLALAYKRVPPSSPEIDVAQLEQGLIFLGLIGLMDPPRPEARDAVSICQQAGIHIVMITGDHPTTAQAIAKQMGILPDRIIPGKRGSIYTGQQLMSLTDQELQAKSREISVYARVAPEQKIRIVKALQASGEIVAMTGDGVNDAPALKRADVGVAMGKGGTDVAREAAHMLLLDDHFATIVDAIREGRRIYDNVRKFVRFSLSGNSGEIWTLFLAPFVQLPVPLLPIQILWVNLVTDGLPGIALTREPEERDLMRKAPRPPNESIFARGLWQHALWVGLLIAGITLSVQAWAFHSGRAHWQTMGFLVLTLTQMGHILAIRSETQSTFKLGLMSNKPLLGAVFLTIFLHLVTIYVPALNPIFKTQPLSWEELFICALLSSIVFFAVEAEKWVKRKKRPTSPYNIT